MDESQSWKDILYILFKEGKLDEARALAITKANGVGVIGCTAALIQGAVVRGEAEDIDGLTARVVEFVKGVSDHARIEEQLKRKRKHTVGTFDAYVTLFLKAEKAYPSAILTREDIDAELHAHYDNFMHWQQNWKKHITDIHLVVAEDAWECMKCLVDYHEIQLQGVQSCGDVVSWTPTSFGMCIYCMRKYVKAAKDDSEEHRIDYEANMKELMTFMSDEFTEVAEGYARKRKRA